MGKVGVYLVLCMVVPGGDACDRLVCGCDTLGCALDVGGGGEGCVFSCLPFCHALFLSVLHCCSGACAPWLRGVGMVAGVSVVWIGVV